MPKRPQRSPRPGPAPPTHGEDTSRGTADWREDRSPAESPRGETARRRARFDRAVLDSLPFFVWLKDIDGRFVAVNRKFAEATGHAGPVDLVGKTDFDLSTRELGERYRADDLEVMRTRRDRTVEEPINLGGRRTWFETFKAPVEDEDGTLLGTVGFARDIDERKRTERLLEVQRDLGVALAEADESGAADAALLKHALDVPGVESAGVYESRQDGALALRVHHGLSDEFAAIVFVMGPDGPEMQELHRGRTIRSWQDFGPQLLALVQREGLRAVVVLPIRRAGQVRGCLNLGSRTADRIDDDTILALETMCLHFGHVLDRLGAQEALRESETRWGFALEGTGDGVWDWHVPSGRVFYSRRWKAMLGYEEHEIGDRYEEWSLRVHPDDRGRVESEPGRHFRGELPNFATEHRLRRKDGTYMWVLDRGRVVQRDAAGNAVRVIGIQTDISERKRAEAALRGSEQFLRDVIASTSDGILVEDGQGRALISNERFAQMWRIAPDMIASSNERAMRGFVLDQLEDPAGFEQKVRALSGTDAECSDVVAFKDGRFFERYSSALMRDGKIAGRVWSFRDATEKRRNETLFRSVIASTPDAFVAFDADLSILDWSPQAEQLFGWTAEEVVGQPAAGTLWPTEVASTLAAGLSRFVRTGRSNVVGRVRRESAVRRDGTEFPAELQLGASLIGDEWRFSGFVRDITERVLADERLAQAEKLEALGQLTGGLAHDFNNVLGIVIGNLDLVSGAASDQERDELLAAARDAADRGAEVTRALLAVARRQELSPRNADPNNLVRELTPLLRHTAGKRIALVIEPGSEPGSSHVDQGGFNNALLNLVINARDAMPEGGEIRIRTEVVTLGTDAPAPLVDGRFNMVEVSDTGMGMPPEVAARAFDPFFTTKGRAKGTGLGLAMVYGFARQSGGTAVVRSAVGRGTTVQIYLPLASEDAASAPFRQPPPHATAAGGHERVLLVDDEPALVSVAARWLRALGYRATGVTAPSEAVRLLASEPFDVLVSDVIMPGEMDGVGLATEAVRLQPGIGVLLVSGYPEGLVENIQGRWPLLDKPFSRDQLDTMIRRCLERGRAARNPEPARRP